jgi:hypothetical protein
MTWWKVKTAEKKNAEEHMLWEKDGMAIRIIEGFRWGSVYVESDDDVTELILEETDSPYGPGVNVYEYETDLDSLDDGWYGDIVFPDDMPQEEQDRLHQLWDEKHFEGLEDEGWVNYDTELWFFGPLDIERVDND